MSQLICQSNSVNVTRSCTHKAGTWETELKLNSKFKLKKPIKQTKNSTDTAEKGSGMEKTHSHLLYW